MRKNIYISLLFVCVLLLSSCLKDNSEVFDKPLAERLDQGVENSKALLESANNGWVLNYYTGRNYSNNGYTLLFKFKDGKVTMMSDQAGPETTGTSSYNVVKDQGLVLTIDTYNQIIHPLTDASLGRPEGNQGDYEFLIIRETQDSIFVRGKRWKNDMVLTRLNNDISQETYVTQLSAIRDAILQNNFKFIAGNDTLANVLINIDGNRFNGTINNVNYSMPFSFTNTGVHFVHPFIINGKEYNDFTWNSQTSTFEKDDIKIASFLPDGFKTIDFWLGTWSVDFTNVSGTRMNMTLTLNPGDGKTYYESVLTVTARRGRQTETTQYKSLKVGYDGNTGGIYLGSQVIPDPSGKYAGGILFSPLRTNGTKLDLVEDGILNYVYNEELETAELVYDKNDPNSADSFVGFGLGSNLQTVIGANGEPERAMYAPEVVSLRNHRPLNNN